MKTSLRSNALVLSLSALVLVTSGCESRRGRMPVKATASDQNPMTPTTIAPKNPTTSPSATPVVTTTTNPVVTPPTDKKPEISTNETQLLVDAQMPDCKVAAIDENASASKASFKADLDLVNAYQTCMKAGGLVLTLSDPDKTRVWALDASPIPADKSAAFVEFARLSKLTNDEAAYKVMKSRLDLSIIRLSKMGTKYSDVRLRSSDIKAGDEIDYYQKKITISGTLTDIQKGAAALAAASDSIKAMKTVDANGVDLTTDPTTTTTTTTTTTDNSTTDAQDN